MNLSLPFQSEVNTGFGVLAKVYLDALTHLNNGQRVRDPNVEGVKEAKAVALEICEETFAGVKTPKLEVERGFRFWDVVSRRFRLPPLGFRSHTRPLPFFFTLFALRALCLCATQTLTAMRQLHSEGAVLRELVDQFEAAEAWLAPMRP